MLTIEEVKEYTGLVNEVELKARYEQYAKVVNGDFNTAIVHFPVLKKMDIIKLCRDCVLDDVYFALCNKKVSRKYDGYIFNSYMRDKNPLDFHEELISYRMAIIKIISMIASNNIVLYEYSIRTPYNTKDSNTKFKLTVYSRYESISFTFTKEAFFNTLLLILNDDTYLIR